MKMKNPTKKLMRKTQKNERFWRNTQRKHSDNVQGKKCFLTERTKEGGQKD